MAEPPSTSRRPSATFQNASRNLVSTVNATAICGAFGPKNNGTLRKEQPPLKKCKSNQNSATKKGTEDLDVEDAEQMPVADEGDVELRTNEPKTVNDIFKERLVTFRKQIMKGMVFSD